MKTKPIIDDTAIEQNCNELLKSVKKNWRKHKTLEYYEYNKPFIDELQTIHLACLKKLKKSDVEGLFGSQPEHGWSSSSFVTYYLSEACINLEKEGKCELLIFALNDGLVRTVYSKTHEEEEFYKRD